MRYEVVIGTDAFTMAQTGHSFSSACAITRIALGARKIRIDVLHVAVLGIAANK